MLSNTWVSFLTLLLMISFASVNAVLFTPSLPAIANFFDISTSMAQLTITWFLVGYTISQLLYGPVANRFGRKLTLYIGIYVQIISSLLCVFAGTVHLYSVLILGRFLLALGSGVGLKMAFTLVHETHETKQANQLIAYLMLAFAIMPGLSVMIGGILSTHFNWTSPFYGSAIYGLILMALVTKLPETKPYLDFDALKLNYLLKGYIAQFKNSQLVAGGLLMGGATSFVYLFAAITPFVAINVMDMDALTYGIANILPPVGLVLGSICSAKLAKKNKQELIIISGIFCALFGSILMLIFILLKLPPILILFVPMILCYFGLSLVLPNISTIVMSKAIDKSNASAVMNFINMGLATLVVLSIGNLQITTFLLPMTYILISFMMIVLCRFI